MSNFKPHLTCCVLTISLSSFYMLNLKCVCPYWTCVSHSLSLMLMYGSASLLGKNGDGIMTLLLLFCTYNPVTHTVLLFCRCSACMYNSLTICTIFLILYDGKECWIVMMPFKLCSDVVITLFRNCKWNFCCMHHRDRHIHDSRACVC